MPVILGILGLVPTLMGLAEKLFPKIGENKMGDTKRAWVVSAVMVAMDRSGLIGKLDFFPNVNERQLIEKLLNVVIEECLPSLNEKL